MLLAFPVGLELGTGWRAGKAQAPVSRKRANLIKRLEKPFASLVLQSEQYSSEVVFGIFVTQNFLQQQESLKVLQGFQVFEGNQDSVFDSRQETSQVMPWVHYTCHGRISASCKYNPQQGVAAQTAFQDLQISTGNGEAQGMMLPGAPGAPPTAVFLLASTVISHLYFVGNRSWRQAIWLNPQKGRQNWFADTT